MKTKGAKATENSGISFEFGCPARTDHAIFNIGTKTTANAFDVPVLMSLMRRVLCLF